EKPSTVTLNCLTETMWARRCRPGRYLVRAFPFDVSQATCRPGNLSPATSRPGFPGIVAEENGKCRYVSAFIRSDNESGGQSIRCCYGRGAVVHLVEPGLMERVLLSSSPLNFAVGNPHSFAIHFGPTFLAIIPELVARALLNAATTTLFLFPYETIRVIAVAVALQSEVAAVLFGEVVDMLTIQLNPTPPTSAVRNTVKKGKEQTSKNSGRPASDAALREYCDKHYHQLLPIIAEKVHQEKTKQEELKEVKARLNFKGCSEKKLKDPRRITTLRFQDSGCKRSQEEAKVQTLP
nr:reverse transcriptase domain-containing protein [Tanacetum cinerariifolium]